MTARQEMGPAPVGLEKEYTQEEIEQLSRDIIEVFDPTDTPSLLSWRCDNELQLIVFVPEGVNPSLGEQPVFISRTGIIKDDNKQLHDGAYLIDKTNASYVEGNRMSLEQTLLMLPQPILGALSVSVTHKRESVSY